MTGAAVSLPERVRPRVPALRLLSDDRLARLAATGNRQAFAEIYRRYHQPLYRYCLSILRHADDASDALQSTAAKALDALPGEERDIALKPWLYRVAHNEAISILRRRRDHASIEDAEPLAAQTPETDFTTREQLRELVSDLAELSERQRGALILRELNGLDYEEIAVVFSVSPAAAKQTVYEARSALHDRAQGRDMDCAEIRRALSDGDRRVARGRRIRAHVKQCTGCREFEALNATRPAQLAALTPPLPATAAAAILQGVLGGGGASGGGGLLAAITGGVATDAGGKAVAIGAATLVAGAGVIGAVTGTLPGMASGAEGGGSVRDAHRDGAAKGGHATRRGGASKQRAAGRRGEGGKGGRGNARQRGGEGAAGGGSPSGSRGSSQSPSGDQATGLPPAGQYVRPQPRPTSGAPAPVDNGGRRITRLTDSVQNIEPPSAPVRVPDAPNLPNVQLP
jgi:RNA polymerase sigma factor (sigma-70 family)